jgi:hypothetical protein
VVAELVLSTPGFNFWIIHIEFMVDEVAQSLGFLMLLWFLSVFSII